MEDVFGINLVKTSLSSCISLIWPLVSSGTAPPPLNQLVLPPFREIIVHGHSAYKFLNLFQTQLLSISRQHPQLPNFQWASQYRLAEKQSYNSFSILELPLGPDTWGLSISSVPHFITSPGTSDALKSLLSADLLRLPLSEGYDGMSERRAATTQEASAACILTGSNGFDSMYTGFIKAEWIS